MANLNAAVDDEPEDPVDPIGEEADPEEQQETNGYEEDGDSPTAVDGFGSKNGNFSEKERLQSIMVLVLLLRMRRMTELMSRTSMPSLEGSMVSVPQRSRRARRS